MTKVSGGVTLGFVAGCFVGGTILLVFVLFFVINNWEWISTTPGAWISTTRGVLIVALVYGGAVILIRRQRKHEARKRGAERQREAEKQRRAEAGRREAERQQEVEARENMAGKPRQWWEVLGISSQAPLEEIMRRYRQEIQLYHPDRVVGLAPEIVSVAERRTKEINAAYAEAKRLRR